MKPPESCRDLADVREAVDALDKKIIGLIGRRARYVQAASRFKTGEEGVRAPERQQKMLVERRRWAEKEDLDPGMVEELYKFLISYFVDREMEEWKRTGP